MARPTTTGATSIGPGYADVVFSLNVEPIWCPDDAFELYLYRGTFDESENNPDMIMLQFAFTVLPADPPPEIASFTAAPRVFYPTIVDGFRDRTVINWQSVRADGATVQIYNAGGELVNRRTWDPRYSGTWAWNGTNTQGRLVAPGLFRLRLSLVNNIGQEVVEFGFVWVRRGVIDRVFRLDRKGVNASRRVRTTGCGFRDLDPELTLACRGGEYAVAKYFFDLPIDSYGP